MKKSEAYKRLSKAGLLDNDEIDDMLETVSDILNDLADELDRDEPYAVISIRELRQSASNVSDIQNLED